MVLRSRSRDVVTLRPGGVVLVAYLGLAALLSAASLSSLMALTGVIIREIPDPPAEKEASRVERWAGSGENRPTAVVPQVRGWTIRGEQKKPPIPLTAIRETEGADPTPKNPAATVDPGTVETAYVPAGSPATAYRTVCVRLCDGAYYPLSFSTTSEHFGNDEAICAGSCGTPARLYFYKNPGEGPDQMVDRAGRSYASLPTAFQFRTRYDVGCTCQGNPWEQQALDRHRLYALELSAERDGGNAEVAQEISRIRERLAAMRPAQAALRPPVYAAASPEVVIDAGTAESPPSAAVPVTVAAAPMPQTPTEQVATPPPDPGTTFDLPKPASDGAIVVPITEIETGTASEPKREAKAKRKLRERPSAARSGSRRPRIIASRPARYVFVRRWSSRTAADETRRNLLRGSF